jgi:hypothetical protein
MEIDELIGQLKARARTTNLGTSDGDFHRMSFTALEALRAERDALREAAMEALDMADEHGGMGWYVALDKLRKALGDSHD